MGAFYISPANYVVPPDVYRLFENKGFVEPLLAEHEKFNLLFYKKQSFTTINHIEDSGFSLYIFGTCFYKNKNYEEGLEAILSDLRHHSLDPANIIGNYFLLFFEHNNFSFYSDEASIQDIFFHPASGLISSSFLACIIGASHISGKLKLNKEALTEVLVTGNLVAPETLVEGIYRYVSTIYQDLPNLKRLAVEYKKDNTYTNRKRSDFNCEIDLQIHQLEDYFSSLKTNLDTLGVATGLTGGFDSRLLLLALKKTTNNYKVYSTKRINPTNEYFYAREFTRECGDDLVSPPHKTTYNISTEELKELLRDNFLFNDGQIRTNQLWTEDIKSRNYVKNLYGNYKIGLSGVGGEQYRNGEYLIKKRYNLANWIFYELIYKNCGNPFSTRKSKRHIVEHLQNKIYRLLSLNDYSQSISFNEIKRYYNEIYNPANRTSRNNIENQLHFFLSPFTDYTLSHEAYHAIPHLGWNHKFEKEMILRLSPHLGHLKMDYGYAVEEDVPFKFYLVPLLKALVGLRLYNMGYYWRKKRKSTFLKSLKENHDFVSEYLESLEKLQLPINLLTIENSHLLATLLLEAAWFLKELEGYVE